MINITYDECFEKIWFKKGMDESKPYFNDAISLKHTLMDKIDKSLMGEDLKKYKEIILFDVVRKNYMDTKDIFMINYTLLISLILNWRTYESEILTVLEMSVKENNNNRNIVEIIKDLMSRNDILKYVSFNEYIKSVEKDDAKYNQILKIREIVDNCLKDQKIWFKEEVSKINDETIKGDVHKQQEIEESPYFIILDDIIQSTDPLMVPYFVKMVLNDLIESEEFKPYIEKVISNGGNIMSVKTLSPSGEFIAHNDVLKNSKLKDVFNKSDSTSVVNEDAKRIIVNNPDYQLLDLNQYNKDAIAEMEVKYQKNSKGFWSMLSKIFSRK